MIIIHQKTNLLIYTQLLFTLQFVSETSSLLLYTNDKNY